MSVLQRFLTREHLSYVFAVLFARFVLHRRLRRVRNGGTLLVKVRGQDFDDILLALCQFCPDARDVVLEQAACCHLLVGVLADLFEIRK